MLGIEPLLERAYRLLLERGACTVNEVAAGLELPVPQAQALLAQAEAKALASHSPERPPRYIAVPPELAIEALIGQRQGLLEQARASIADLRQLAGSAARQADRDNLVEVIAGRAALGPILQQLLRTVQSEILGFQRAPVFYSELNLNPPGQVRMRSVSDTSYIEIPGRLEVLRQVVAMGEEARFFDPLPLKMVVVDRRVAVIPLSVDDQGGPSLLIRESSLVAALCALFDLTWDRATPISFTRSGKLQAGRSARRMSQAAEAIIPLLASGMADKVIASTTALPRTTFNRRIAELMRVFDARSRFQLGWRAALAAFGQDTSGTGHIGRDPADRP